MSVESPNPTTPVPPPGQPTQSALFALRQSTAEPVSWTPWIAAAAVVLIIALLLVVTHHDKPAAPNALLAPAPYASSLAVSTLPMSESTSLSGGKVTYIDGKIKNNGASVLTSATVQVVFANDEAMPPQIETLPLTLIRTHEPYVDTEPVSADPIAPGQEREFRLIFESIGTNWNGQIPKIQVIQTSQK